MENTPLLYITCNFLPAGLALYDKTHSKVPSQFILKQKEELQREVDELLGTDGVLLYPTHPFIAPKHHHPLFTPSNVAYTGRKNMLFLWLSSSVRLDVLKDSLISFNMKLNAACEV